MKIEEAQKLLKQEYEKATKNAYVRDKVAYALYQVWKKADAERYRREDNGKN